jgi:hypothetical protein
LPNERLFFSPFEKFSEGMETKSVPYTSKAMSVRIGGPFSLAL